MTRNDDFIDHLEGYLDEFEGSTPLPDEVRDAIRAQLPSIQQRPAWWPAWRFPEMNTTTKIAVAAAAVVVVAIFGFGFLGPGLNVGGPDPTPEPTVTPVALPAGGPLDPGTYYVAEGTPGYASWGIHSPTGRFTFTVPASGWARNSVFVDKHHDEPNDVSLSAWIVSHVYADACNWRGTLVDVGTTVDELTSALVGQGGRDVSAPTDVVVGGFPAQRIEMTVAAGLDVATCDNAFLRSWPSAGPDESGGLGVGPGSTDVVYIVDVDGSRLVVVAGYLAPSSEQDRAELEAMVESIVLEP